MIDIEFFEAEITKILKVDSGAIAEHPEITRSAEKKAALDGLKGLATVGSYQGDLEAILTRNIIPLPAALIIYDGARDENEKVRDGARGTVDVSFVIYVIGENLSGGGDASLDVRRMLTAVRTALNGLVCRSEGRDRTLLWTAESLSMIANTGVCAYEQKYQYKDWLET